MPLSNFVPRGFGFVYHSIAILYHEVPNLSLYHDSQLFHRRMNLAVAKQRRGAGGSARTGLSFLDDVPSRAGSMRYQLNLQWRVEKGKSPAAVTVSLQRSLPT